MREFPIVSSVPEAHFLAKMSKLYPDLFASVEDQVCHNMIVKQNEAILASNPSAPSLYDTTALNFEGQQSQALYPVLTRYMGVDLDLTNLEIAELTNYVAPGVIQHVIYIRFYIIPIK